MLFDCQCVTCVYGFIMSGPIYGSGVGGMGRRFQEQPSGEHRFLSDDLGFGTPSCPYV